MITIDQLLESVDLDFEPRFVTKGKLGEIWLWANKPHINPGDTFWSNTIQENKQMGACRIKLSEFDGKNWTECIYEVPRKTTGKIEKLEPLNGLQHNWLDKINELVDYVNALIESNNIHEKQIDELQMKLEPEKCAVNTLNQVIDVVNKHADILQQIGDWGTRKGECLWCETLTKFEPNELKGAKNE